LTAHEKLLFCGSVGLSDAEAVFRALAGSVGARARRYPDGETGERHHWFLWQSRIFRADPAWEVGATVDMQFGGWEMKARPYLQLRAGIDPAAYRFAPLEYARVALESWEVFKRLRDAGVIPAGTRLQVALPTPAAVIVGLVVESQRAAIEPAYEAALRREVEAIVAAIPAADLAIQWDVCTEILCYEGGPETCYYDDIVEGTLVRLARLSTWVPEGVELGFHLCYGDPGHKHIVEPRDTEVAVRFANAIAERVRRRVDWIHVPVPRERDDDAYFAPLAGLRLAPDTELYLGLIHARLGSAGSRRLIAAAERHVPEFGIATECGFGRRDPATIPALLRLHAELAGG
jgi:hypothetical protein